MCRSVCECYKSAFPFISSMWTAAFTLSYLCIAIRFKIACYTKKKILPTKNRNWYRNSPRRQGRWGARSLLSLAVLPRETPTVSVRAPVFLTHMYPHLHPTTRFGNNIVTDMNVLRKNMSIRFHYKITNNLFMCVYQLILYLYLYIR